MTDPTNNPEQIPHHQDEISSDIEHVRRSVNPDDDSFKTPPRTHRLGWERPLDEQMYDSFDDIREQEGIRPGDEEAD